MDFSKLTADEEVGVAFEAVGHAITAWARVEGELCNVFTACISPAYTLQGTGFVAPRGPSIAFYAIENFRSKLLVTDKMLRFHVQFLQDESDIIKCWERVHRHTRRLSVKRNRLGSGLIAVARR